MFVNNKYYKWYNSIIVNAQNSSRSKKTDHYEQHHIIPKCFGGSNDRYNLVLLTPSEHYIVHMLLVRCVERKYVYKMVAALARFFKRVANTSKHYELYKQTMSKYSKGKYNASYGKIWIHDIETKDISYVLKTEFEHYDKSKFKKGLPFQRGGYSNYTWLYKDLERTAVPHNKVEQYLLNGWTKGRNVVFGEEHFKKMSAAAHTPEKNKIHSEKLKGKVTMRNPENTKSIRVDNDNVSQYIANGFTLLKGSGIKMVTSSGKSITIDGITYKSMSDAHRQTGIPYSRIIKMNKSYPC